jgi:hypothetical protein
VNNIIRVKDENEAERKMIYKGVKVRWQKGPSVAISVIFSYMCFTFLRAHTN